MKKLVSLLLVLAMVLGLCACGGKSADSTSTTLVYKNGNIYTANANQDYVTAVVIQDGKFVYAGDDAGAAAYEKGLPAENIVDLDGKLVTPGLIEGHTHPFLIAAMNAVKFEDVDQNLTLEQSLDALKKFVADHPDYEQYAIGNFGQSFDLDATQLDAICADKPVVCFGSGFHCCYVNSKFMEKGGINKDTPDAVPGESYYVRDAQGNPTGKIIELVETWISFNKALPLSKETITEEFAKMRDLYHTMGFVGFAEGATVALDEETMLEALKDMEAADELNMIVCPATIWYGHTVTDINEVKERALSQKEKYTSELIHPGTVKMWADGTIGAYSALLTEPYDDKPDVYGNQITTVEDLITCAQMCKENDLNCHFHAIGDQAIDNALTAYETVGESTGTQSVVHFTVSTPEMIQKASKIKNLIVNVCPSWANSYVKEETEPIGSRRDTYTLYKETMDAGVTVNFGADSNGSSIAWDPALNILAAMCRSPYEEGVLLKGKPCTFEEAVDAYSINVAKERRIDGTHGSVEVGKNADLTIWDVPAFTQETYDAAVTKDGQITDIRPYAQQCVLNGKVVYTRKK